jgi:hypothetical protein
MKRKSLIFIITILAVLTLGGSFLQAASFDFSNYTKEQDDSMSVLLSKLRDGRAKLIEAQTEVVSQANDAKLRVEEILKQSITEKKALSTEQVEKLKKDLEIIKSNQEIINTVLADISAAAADMDEVVPTKDSINKLIALYSDKAVQLNEVAKSLAGVASKI